MYTDVSDPLELISKQKTSLFRNVLEVIDKNYLLNIDNYIPSFFLTSASVKETRNIFWKMTRKEPFKKISYTWTILTYF